MKKANKKSRQLKDKNIRVTNNKKLNQEKKENLNNDKKEELNEFILKNYNNFNSLSEIKKLSKNDKEYRQKLDERMDILMKKIDEKINNNKYTELSSIITNYKSNIINDNDEEEKIKEISVENKVNQINNKNQINKNNINIKNNINRGEQILEINKEESDKENEETKLNKSAVFPTKVQIICKTDNEINTKLFKRCKFLENEANYLKFKLENVQKQKDFLQQVIMNNPNINKSLFDIFMVEYYKKIASNWKEISDKIIDELITDEIHELTKIKLELRKAKREKEKEEHHDFMKNKIISPIEIEEFILFNDNLQSIKKVIRSVKQSEKNLCKKYKVKVKLNNLK